MRKIAAGLFLLGILLLGGHATQARPDGVAPAPLPMAPPGAPPGLAALTISGELKVPAHGLVKLRLDGADPKAGVVWRVTPRSGVALASWPRGVQRTLLEFAAPPGVYRVDALCIKNRPDGGTDVDETSVEVTVGTPPIITPPIITPPGPVLPRPGKASPAAATVRLRVGKSGCTATIMSPRRADGKWDVLTAAHCTGDPGSKGVITLKDGRSLDVTVTVRSRSADITWLVTESNALADLPYADLATQDPSPGTPIWHNGFGIDKPGNREDGQVQAGSNAAGLLRMYLNVSPGDSGGGIFRSDNGQLVAAVCCTSRLAAPAVMYGGSCTTAARLRPTPQLTHPVITDTGYPCPGTFYHPIYQE